MFLISKKTNVKPSVINFVRFVVIFLSAYLFSLILLQFSIVGCNAVSLITIDIDNEIIKEIVL